MTNVKKGVIMPDESPCGLYIYVVDPRNQEGA
jgi:hypothetical protein